MKRVAITTDRFDAVADAYAGVGLDPVEVPCVSIEPASAEVLESARRAVSGADLVIITSARTVGVLWPAAPMPAVDVAAVGPVTAKAVDAAISVITKALKKGDSVTLVGFGTFQVRERAAREGRNPKTGETIKIKKSKNPSFKAGKALKDAVN